MIKYETTKNICHKIQEDNVINEKYSLVTRDSAQHVSFYIGTIPHSVVTKKISYHIIISPIIVLLLFC